MQSGRKCDTRGNRRRFPVTKFALGILLGGMAAIAANRPALANHLTFQDIADTFAGSVVESGQVVGVGVAIIDGPEKPKFFTYGHAVAPTTESPGKDLKPGSLFWMGSVSKVFTMNLLGQRIHSGAIRPDQPLSDFSAQIGPMKQTTSTMTIKQLASFTGGLLDTPPGCTEDFHPAWCLPGTLPSLQDYPVWRFMKYIQTTEPKNFQKPKKPVVDRLPTSWNYSNYSAALTGLLIGGKPGERLRNGAVRGWYRAVRSDILMPLGMTNTFLNVPSDKAKSETHGYDPAQGKATVVKGAVAEVDVLYRGSGYVLPLPPQTGPKVEIIGGGGSGAEVVAYVGGNGGVLRFKVLSGGSNYVPPPTITFKDGNGNALNTIKANAIVSNGKVVGVDIMSGGSNLTQAPEIHIEGGQPNGGTPAQLKAIIAGGAVTYVRVVDPGSGYADPIKVAVAPGDPASFTYSPMAPAGFLASNLRDMAVFARAALADDGKLGSRKSRVREGFRISERPYACTVHGPRLKNCPDTAPLTGYAWMIDTEREGTIDLPTVISKDGGIAGYSTFIALMPERQIAVVVSVNSRSTVPTEHDLPPVGAPAAHVAQHILNAIFYECHRYGLGHPDCQ